MPAYLETWDPTQPAGSSDISLGDDAIRRHMRAVTERLGTDHEFQTDETGNNKIGYHKKVTLTKQTADPSSVAGCGILYSKDVGSGLMEAFFIDEAGNITQLTKRGSVNRISKEVTMWFGTIASLPSGWYLCDGTGGRPDLRDQFIVCARQDSGGVVMSNVTGALAQSATPTHNHGGLVGATTLTLAQIPAHTHTVATDNGGTTSNNSALGRSGSPFGTMTTGSSGGGTSHDHTISAGTAIPPFFALAMITQYNS